MHVFVALIFIYDVFALIYSFTNIEDCKSPKQHLVLYKDSSSLTSTEAGCWPV